MAAPLGEVVDHAGEALPQRHLGLPAQRLLYLRDPQHASPVTHHPRNQLFMFPVLHPYTYAQILHAVLGLTAGTICQGYKDTS